MANQLHDATVVPEYHADGVLVNTVPEITKMFESSGCLLIRQVFNQELIQQIKAEAIQPVRNSVFRSSLDVGDRRKMHTVKFHGPWSQPDLYANRKLLRVVRACLGQKVRLGSMTLVNSLPGAEAQHIHRDHFSLFPSQNGTLDMTPSYAITVLVPLVEQNGVTGNTRVWLGSHRAPSVLESKDVGADYKATPGDCLLMDYRLLHAGLANKANFERPLLSMVYTNSWFKDECNFRLQSPLILSARSYKRVSARNRELFSGHVGLDAKYMSIRRTVRRIRKFVS